MATLCNDWVTLPLLGLGILAGLAALLCQLPSEMTDAPRVGAPAAQTAGFDSLLVYHDLGGSIEHVGAMGHVTLC